MLKNSRQMPIQSPKRRKEKKMLKSMINPDLSGKKTSLVLGFMLIMVFAMSTSLMAQTNALDFDGENDKVENTNSHGIIANTTTTLEAWVKIDAQEEAVFVGNGNTYQAIGMNSSGQFVSRSYDGSSSHRNNSGYTLEIGIWYHVSAVFTGGNSTNYVNGVQQGSTASCPSGSTENEYYYLGYGYITAECYFNGQIDEARIWSDVRTQTELQEYICSDVSSAGATLLVYYRMTDGSGTTLTDNSTNSNTGTLYNMDNSDWVTDYLVPVGDGTSGTEYQIQTLNHLYWLSQTSVEWGKLFEQTADIDMTVTQNWNDDHSGDAEGFSPIGNTTTKFTGSYNGGEYTINNLYIDRSGIDGLFGWAQSATISNTGVTNVSISSSGANVGALVAYNDNTSISNCYSTGSVTGSSNYYGGLCGTSFNSSSINASYSTCSVNCRGKGVGGLIGIVQSPSTINNCYSTGSVVGSGSVGYVGGLCGENKSTISKSYSASSASSEGDRVGGLVGYNWSTGTISNCYSKGNVTRTDGSNNNYGGFVGNNAGTIEYCYSIGDVTLAVGTNLGFAGYNYEGTYRDNFWDSEASNQTTATGATAQTTDEMKTESTYTAVWDFTNTWEMIGTNYPQLRNNPDPTLPVTLSSFTAQYIEDTPILCWTTQSETSNAGWNIYRGESEEALSNEEAYQLNLSLGLIPGAGTTSLPTEYSFEDVFPIYLGTTYFYWLESVDYSGESEIYGPISLTIPENEWQNPNSPEIPKNYGLHQNYPNPFNPNTAISFMMKENCICELSIYNVKGQKIRTIFSNLSIPRNELLISNWNGKDEKGKEVSTGIYYYKLSSPTTNMTKKMILMK